MTTKVLFDVRTDNGERGLGDILISTPVIRRLKQKYGYLDYLVREKVHCLLEGNPYINHVLSKANPQDYDLHLVLGQRLEDYSIKRNRQPRIDAMAELFGVLPRGKEPEIYSIKTGNVIENSLGIHIESTSPLCRWSIDYLQELVCVTNYDCYIFGTGDYAIPEGAVDYRRLPLRESMKKAAAMSRFFCSDSFFSHLVAALDIPSVIFYTAIKSGWFCVYYPEAVGIQAGYPCSPCHDHQLNKCEFNEVPPCSLAITSEIVLRRLEEVS